MTVRRQQITAVLLAAVAFFASAPGQSFLIAVFVDDLLAGTGLGRTTFSVLYAAGTVVSAITMLLLGRVIDRRGLRVAWVTVTVALALACGLASVAAGAVTAFLALALLRTFGQGSFPLLGTMMVARWFRRRGQGMAVASLGITVASVVLPPSVAALILAVGWRHAYQLVGAALLVAVLPLALLVRERRERSADPGSTEHAGSFPTASRGALGGRVTIPNAPAAQMLFVLAGPPLIATALTFHGVSILAERGLSFLQAGWALSVLGVASALGTVVSGLVVDRVSNRTLLSAVALSVLAAPAMLLVPATAAAYGAFGLLGISMGATGVVNGAVWARTYGTAQLGQLQGTAQSSMITAAAVAPLVPALSHGTTGTYTAALVALLAFAAVTVLCAVRWRIDRVPGGGRRLRTSLPDS